MEHGNSKEKEVIVDIESGEAHQGALVQKDPVLGNKSRKISLNKLVSGVLGFKGSVDVEPVVKSDSISNRSVEHRDETLKLLGDKSLVEQQSHGLTPPVEKDNEKGRQKAVKVKKAPKPPRPPKGPLLDAADMRLVKEISKIAMKKRERIERVKALKKMKAARSPSQSSSSSSLGGTISAMLITVLFFLVLIFQALGSSSSSNITTASAPQPAPETTTEGLTPVQFYKTVISDDGAAPSFVPPKSAE